MAKQSIATQLAGTLEQAQRAVAGVRALTRRDLPAAIELLATCRGKVVVSGIGKSGYIAQKIASSMVSLGIAAQYLNPAEAMHGDLGAVAVGDAIVAISYSGETKELLRMLRHVAHRNVPVVAITGKKSSSLAKLSTQALVIKVAAEGSPYNVAPMASSTASLVVGDLLAAGLSVKKGFTDKDFAKSHPGGALGLRLTPVAERMRTGKALPTVRVDATFHAAVKEITDKKAGITAVVDARGRLAGVVSDGDVRRFVLKHSDVRTARAQEAMTRAPKCIAEGASLADALALMEQYKITTLFVVDTAKRPVGALHIHDLLSDAV